MLKPKKIIQIISAFVLLAILWIAFLLIQGLFERHISNHEMYIPKNSESVLEINGEELIQTFVQDVLLKRQFDDKLEEYVYPSESSESLGIDYLSTFYVFTVEKDARILTGILVNVLDDEQFEFATKTDQEDGTGYAVKNGVGLMLYSSEKSPMSLNDLNTYALSIVEKQSGFDLKKLPKPSEKAKLKYWRKEYTIDNGTRSFYNISLSMSIEGKTLEIKGIADFQTFINRSYPILKRNDLSIQSQFIPNNVNAFLSKNLEFIGFNFPKITYLSGNYHYSEPSPIPELKVLPHFDGIYAFDENFRIRIPLLALAASGKVQSLNLKSFDLGGKTIYYKQIDSKTIYLGQSKYSAGPAEKNTLFEVQGDLKQLLEIRNGGMLTKFLAISPEYVATERFLKGIVSSDFYIKDKDGETVDLYVKMKYQDGKSAFNEALQLVLDLGLFD